MKATTLKLILLKLPLLLMVTRASAQDLTGTRIDVQGTRFSDQMWLFSVASCTYGFDNGWDGFKMFGTALAPQIFAWEPDGYYQVASIPDVNNTYLGFSAGIDTMYTFTFTHQKIEARYQKLYLIDSVEQKIVDIYSTGAKYSFTSHITAKPVKRFKIVTSDTGNLSGQTISSLTLESQPTSNNNNLKIYYSNKNIFIQNAGNQKGTITLCHAENGMILKSVDFTSNNLTVIPLEIPIGSYIIHGITPTENVTSKILVY